MKHQHFITAMLLLCLVASISYAATNPIDKSRQIKFNSIYVTTNKTTTLRFPLPVKNITVGCQDIRAVKAEGMENTLHVNATAINFRETNMTVVTTDGSIYSFLVNYSIRPTQLAFSYEGSIDTKAGDQDESTVKTIKKTTTMEADISSTASQLLASRKRQILGLHDRNGGMVLQLRGIHTKNDVLYFQLAFENHTDQDYLIDSVQFYIKDQFKNALNVFQQVEIKPFLIAGNQSNIKANSNETIVVATPRFIIPYLKYLVMSVNEKNKENRLSIKINDELLSDIHVIN